MINVNAYLEMPFTLALAPSADVFEASRGSVLCGAALWSCVQDSECGDDTVWCP